MSLIPPFFTDCVVALGFADQDGNVNYTASGFFYGRPIKGSEGFDVYLVTNKHVLNDEATVYVRVNPAADGVAVGYEVPLKDASGSTTWTGHAETDVDVAVLAVNFGLLQTNKHAAHFFEEKNHSANTKRMRDDGLSEGDGVFVLGFPMGLVGKDRSSVIVRGGVISRLRDTLQNSREPFLVDATVFPGNSGGPVVSRPDINAIQGTSAQSSANLIGIVAQYLAYNDIAVSPQTGRTRVVFEENSGLAQIYSVDCIVETIKRQKLQQKQVQKATQSTAAIEEEAKPEDALNKTKARHN